MSGSGEQIEEGTWREHRNLPLKGKNVFVTRYQSGAVRRREDDQIVIVRITRVHRRVGVRVGGDASVVGYPPH